MAGSEHLHLPHNATAHRAARANSHDHFGAQTQRLRSGYVDWRCYDGEQSVRGYVRASGCGVALLSLPSLHYVSKASVQYQTFHDVASQWFFDCTDMDPPTCLSLLVDMIAKFYICLRAVRVTALPYFIG